MLSQTKSAMAALQRELETSIQPLKCQQFTWTKAYRQSVSLNCATNIISQLMFAFTGRNRFISMESLWRHLKTQKLTVTLIYAHIYPFISKLSQSIWWPSPFKWIFLISSTKSILHTVRVLQIRSKTNRCDETEERRGRLASVHVPLHVHNFWSYFEPSVTRFHVNTSCIGLFG